MATALAVATLVATASRNQWLDLLFDYVWGIGVAAPQAHTVASTAADHRALVMNVTRTGR